MARNDSFFKRLTRLFRSGPAVQRRVKGYGAGSYYDANLVQGGTQAARAPSAHAFGHSTNQVSGLGQYDLMNRVARYSEFAEMEYTGEIASALDIYADETVATDQDGKALHIFSDNIQIKKALEELFFDILNVEFNLRSWVRNLVKYGDFFLYNEVLPDIGVVNAQPIPVDQIEREEGFDPEDPYAIRFKWLAANNVSLENWQVTHMRILGNDLFLPYGTSVLESSRRIWRMLSMLEDAMMVYRVVRSPERRVFYIDVGNVAPNDVPSYMEAAKATLRSQNIMGNDTGKQDMRHNPMAVDEDYYIPVRGTQSGTKIDTLAGGSHVTATEDIEYMQSKLFSALKVPKPYLNYDENLSSKATLAQEDVRFSRSIQSIQKVVVAELNKLAMIHLFSKGFDGGDLVDFEVKLSNPSTVALQQKLELWSTKMEVAGTAKETKLVDEKWIQQNLLELTDDEIDNVEKGLYQDKVREVQLDAMEFEEELYQDTTTDDFHQSGYKPPGGGTPGQVHQTQEPEQQAASRGGDDVLVPYDKGNPYRINHTKGSPPIKATPFMTRNKKNRTRRVGQSGAEGTASPNTNKMLSAKNRSLKDIYDQEFLRKPYRKEAAQPEVTFESKAGIPKDVRSMLSRLKDHLHRTKPGNGLLNEDFELEETDEENDNQGEDYLLNAVLEQKSAVTDSTEQLPGTTLKEALGDEEDQTKTSADDEDDGVDLEIE